MEKLSQFLKNYSTSVIFLIVVQPVFYGCVRFTESLDRCRIYFMFYALFACAFVAYLLTFFSAIPPVYTAEHARLYDFDNTAFQRHIYILYAAVLFVTALFLAMTRRTFSFPFFRDFRNTHRLSLETIVSVLILILALPLFFNYLGDIAEKRAFLTVIGCLVVFLALLGYSNSVKGRFILSAITLGVFFLYFILPLQSKLIVADGMLWGMDHHWTGVIGHGLISTIFPPDTLKSMPEYGMYLNKLISAASGLSMFAGFGGALKFLQVIHILFAALIFAILLQRFGHRHVNLVLISFLLILLILAPILSGSAPTLQVPNQSPIRFLFIPVTLLFAQLLARPGILVWWTAAALLSAFAVSYNLEIGLVCTLGLGFALFIRSMNSGYLYVLSGGILFAAIFILTAYLLLSFGVSGAENFSDMSSLLSLFAEGYGGKKFYWYLPFFIITAHVFYLFFGWVRDSRETGPISGKEVQSIAIAGMIIAFMPYVANRFYEQNMWIPVLLYLLLILPKMATKDFLGKAAILLFVIAIIGPSQLEKSSLFVKNLKTMWTLDRTDGCLNGLAASSRLCDYVNGQATELHSVAERENIVWISAIPLTLSSLSKVPPPLSRADPFAYARTPGYQQNLLDEIRAQSPDMILIDRVDILNPTGIAIAVADWQKRLVKEAGYRIVRTTDYWVYAEKPN